MCWNFFFFHCLRGLDNSGKTTIVLKINGEDTSVISPTLGFNIKTINYQKYAFSSLFLVQFLFLLRDCGLMRVYGRYILNIWDVGGQKTIRSYWRNYFEQTDGLVWVVDSSDLRRLDDCKHELDNLLKEEVHFCLLFLFLIFGSKLSGTWIIRSSERSGTSFYQYMMLILWCTGAYVFAFCNIMEMWILHQTTVNLKSYVSCVPLIAVCWMKEILCSYEVGVCKLRLEVIASLRVLFLSFPPNCIQV